MKCMKNWNGQIIGFESQTQERQQEISTQEKQTDRSACRGLEARCEWARSMSRPSSALLWCSSQQPLSLHGILLSQTTQFFSLAVDAHPFLGRDQLEAWFVWALDYREQGTGGGKRKVWEWFRTGEEQKDEQSDINGKRICPSFSYHACSLGLLGNLTSMLHTWVTDVLQHCYICYVTHSWRQTD